MIAAIIEEKKVQLSYWSYGNHSTGIAVIFEIEMFLISVIIVTVITTIAEEWFQNYDRYDWWPFFSAIVAIVAIIIMETWL